MRILSSLKAPPGAMLDPADFAASADVMKADVLVFMAILLSCFGE